MEQAITNLGTKELHKNKSVMIEGGKYPRARVMDQTMIDRFLMRGEINLSQHQAGEYLLRQAGNAGAWPTGVNWAGVSGGSRNYVPFRAFPFGHTLSVVERKFGWYHADLLKLVVCHDWDISKNKNRMTIFKQALDWIAKRLMNARPVLKRSIP